MKYKWSSKRDKNCSRRAKQHLCYEDGRTFCKAENGSWRLDFLSDTPHASFPICKICVHLKEKFSERGSRKIDAGFHAPKNQKYADLLLRTYEWKVVRYRALLASNGRCQACGRSASDGAVLNVDHIKARAKHPELALTLSNLQVLCHDCNKGKGNWDATDWR